MNDRTWHLTGQPKKPDSPRGPIKHPNQYPSKPPNPSPPRYPPPRYPPYY